MRKDKCVYLISAVTLSHGLRQMMCARRVCALLAESCPSSVLPLRLESSDIDEVKYRNAHLSH